MPFEPILTMPGIVRFNYKNATLREKLIDKNKTLSTHSDLLPNQQMQAIIADTVANAAALAPTRPATRGRVTNMWSPLNQMLHQSLKHLILISRHVFGYRHYPKWTEHTFRNKLKSIRHQWTRDICKLNQDNIMTELDTLMPKGPMYWAHQSLQQLSRELPDAVMSVRRLFTRKLRQQRAREYREKCQQREKSFQMRQIGVCIQSLFRKYKSSYRMEDLLFDGLRTTSPGMIHDVITHHFHRTWFNTPPEYVDLDWLLKNRSLYMPPLNMFRVNLLRLYGEL